MIQYRMWNTQDGTSGLLLGLNREDFEAIANDGCVRFPTNEEFGNGDVIVSGTGIDGAYSIPLDADPDNDMLIILDNEAYGFLDEMEGGLQYKSPDGTIIFIFCSESDAGIDDIAHSMFNGRFKKDGSFDMMPPSRN